MSRLNLKSNELSDGVKSIIIPSELYSKYIPSKQDSYISAKSAMCNPSAVCLWTWLPNISSTNLQSYPGLLIFANKEGYSIRKKKLHPATDQKHRPSQEWETSLWPLPTKTTLVEWPSRSWETHKQTRTHRPPGHVPSSQEISAQSIPTHPAWWLTEKTVTHTHTRTEHVHKQKNTHIYINIGLSPRCRQRGWGESMLLWR